MTSEEWRLIGFIAQIVVTVVAVLGGFYAVKIRVAIVETKQDGLVEDIQELSSKQDKYNKLQERVATNTSDIRNEDKRHDAIDENLKDIGKDIEGIKLNCAKHTRQEYTRSEFQNNEV